MFSKDNDAFATIGLTMIKTITAETRPMLIKALHMLANKREKQLPRKHGNINL